MARVNGEENSISWVYPKTSAEGESFQKILRDALEKTSKKLEDAPWREMFIKKLRENKKRETLYEQKIKQVRICGMDYPAKCEDDGSISVLFGGEREHQISKDLTTDSATHIDRYGIERDSKTLLSIDSDGLVKFTSIKSTFEPGDL